MLAELVLWRIVGQPTVKGKGKGQYRTSEDDSLGMMLWVERVLAEDRGWRGRCAIAQASVLSVSDERLVSMFPLLLVSGIH